MNDHCGKRERGRGKKKGRVPGCAWDNVLPISLDVRVPSTPSALAGSKETREAYGQDSRSVRLRINALRMAVGRGECRQWFREGKSVS